MYERKAYHKATITRYDGDANLEIDTKGLRRQLRRAYRHSQESPQSYVQVLDLDWQLSLSRGRQAMFCVLETEEKLLAARFRVGNDYQLVVVGSASRHGAFGPRVKILKSAKAFVEPAWRDGKTRKRGVWQVWDPFTKRSAGDDYWPTVVRYLENTTPSTTTTDLGCCLASAKALYGLRPATPLSKDVPNLEDPNFDGQEQCSDADSDVPLSERHQHVPNPVLLESDSDGDIPLRDLRDRYITKSSQQFFEKRSIPGHSERRPSMTAIESIDKFTTPSSSCDNKDYHYWQGTGVIDQVP